MTVKLRWSLRSLFIAPFALCIALWIASFVRQIGVAHAQGSDGGSAITIVDGSVAFVTTPYSMETGWNFQLSPIDRTGDAWDKSDWRFLGFRHGKNVSFLKFSYFVIPFWFPTTLLAAPLWLVWRMTRRTPVGRAFPLESEERQTNDATRT